MDSSASRHLDKFVRIVAGMVSISIVPAVVLLILLAWVTWTDAGWRGEAIKRGYALYCPDTGKFAWKGECCDD